MLEKYANMPKHKCLCNKENKHIQSYHRHIKDCTIYRTKMEEETSKNSNVTWRVKKKKKNIDNEIVNKSENEDLRNMITTLIKQNQSMLLENTEMREILKDVIPRIGNTTINNKFNLHIFLNEQCKDALNFTDLIETLA